MLKDSQKMSDIYFHTDVTLVDRLTLQGGYGQVYPCILTHLKLELPHKICLGSLKFTVHSFQGFVPSRTFCIHAECHECHICPYCNKSHNSRDSLMNHVQFHYRMVLVCPICGSCGSNKWRTVEDTSRNVLQLNLMWLTETSNQANHIGENQTHHLRTILELQRQRLHTLCQYGLTHQT